MRCFAQIGLLGLVCCGLVALGAADLTVAQDCVSWELRGNEGPSPRSQLAMAYDSGRGVTVLFGGVDDSVYLGDTWEWDGNEWTLRSTGGPSPRHGTAMAYDPDRGVTVLFGGSVGYHYGAFRDDTWEWDGDSWTHRDTGSVRPSAAFTPRDGL